MATKWEYSVMKLQGHWDTAYVEEVLNARGQQGWEAVSLGWMVAGQNGGGDAAVLLKRVIAHPHTP